jgi:transcription elongation factor GreA
MTEERFPISPKGYKQLEKELLQFKTIERPAIIAAIAEARAHGDLSENAEYSAAKEKQSFIEAKIADLEARIARAHVIDETKIVSDSVQFGATVKIVDEESGEKIIYKIVSEYEANLELKMISYLSPVAKALIGKKVGESIEVSTPGGFKYYEIISIEFK